MSPVVTLLSDQMPDLLPMQGRSPGLHLSDVINDLSIIQGHYQRPDANDPHLDHKQKVLAARFAIGNTFEWAMIQRMKLDNPDRYWQCGELPGFDGLVCTPDIVDKWHWRPDEFKFTWESLRYAQTPEQVLTSEKFWKRKTQLAYQALCLGTNEGTLPIMHPMGDYSYGELGGPAYRQWLWQWTKQELIDNRDRLLSHRDTMIKEGRGRR